MQKRKRVSALAGAILLTVALPIAISQDYFRYDPYPLPVLGLLAVILYLWFFATSEPCKNIIRGFYSWNHKLSLVGFIIVGAIIVGSLGMGEWLAIRKSKDHINKLRNESKSQAPAEQPRPPANEKLYKSPAQMAESKQKTEGTKSKEKQQTQSMERPYFVLLYGPEIIKATPDLKAQFGTDYVVEVKVKNKGEHAATNLYSRQIIIDQNFQTEPNITEGSKGNEFPASVIATYHFGIKFLHETILPSYLIIAIKYHDKETQFQKRFSQIWCFKQPGYKIEAPIFNFFEASIREREEILNHLREQLKDYQITKY